MDLPAENQKEHLGKILSSTADSNFNVVLFGLPYQETGLSGTPGKNSAGNPVEWTIAEARRLGMKIYISLRILNPGQAEAPRGGQTRPQNTSQNDDRESGLAMAAMKTRLKDQIHDLARKYDMDGFLFDLTEFSPAEKLFETAPSVPGMSDPVGDLLEDIAVEGMLLKPYLVNLCAVPAELFLSSPLPPAWLKKGFLDGVVTVFEPENIIYQKINAEPRNRDLPGFLFHGFRVAGDNQLPDTQFLENVNGFVIFPNPEESLPSWIPNIGSPVKKPLPDSLKTTRPEEVYSFDLSRIIEEGTAGRMVEIFQPGRKKITDAKGRIGFVEKMPFDSLRLFVEDTEVELSSRFWQVPYDYVVLNDGKVTRKPPWIEFRNAPGPVIYQPEFHLLCKTDYPSKAWINGDTVKVYETGIFFKTVRFDEGLNRIEAGIISSDSTFTTYTQEINYIKKPDLREPFPLWIDERSINPQMDLVLLPDDRINISFRGSRGQNGMVVFLPENRSFRCNRTDFPDYSIYEAEIPLNDWEIGRKFNLSLVLMPEEPGSGLQGLEITPNTSLTIRNSDKFPWIRVVGDHTRLTYNLGAVRLGGPLRAEYPPGVVMKTNGIFGDQYRVFLNPEEQGFIRMEEVEELSSTYFRSPYFITSLSAGPSASADIVSIPYPVPIPYAIFPEPELRRIRVRLYGAKTSSTWISHRQGCRLVDRISWEQVTPETYDVHVYLKTAAIWGYELARQGNSLSFRIKYPPEYNPSGEQPLKGLKIAIEAGHGGESYGAMGLSGLLEKDINLDLAHRFGDVCRSYGAKIFQVRDADTTMSLLDKRELARNSGADLLISVHANAAGTSRGFLGVSGTSTYYHNPFWGGFAERMYDHLLELGLEEFGVVGSFNYTVIRNSELPSILVEQAFMTHAGDEEKLARPSFRQTMAEKMYDGLIDYLKYMKEEQ